MIRLLTLMTAISFAALSATKTASAAGGQLVDQIKDSKEKITQTDLEKRRVLGHLYAINQRMKKIVREKSHLTDEMYKSDQAAKSIAQVVHQLEQKIAEQKIRLRARLRAMYELSGESYLSILFSQNSAHDLDQSLKFLQIIAKKDQDLILGYRESVAEREQQKTQLKKQVARLLSVERGIKEQESLLESEQTAKGKMVASLEHNRDEQLKKMKGLRQRALATSDAIAADDEALNLTFFEKKGQLPPPVHGELVKDFGLMFDEATKLQTSHKGWRYQTSEGADVAAVFTGRVVYGSHLTGYGPTVIIDHGDHYYTVYAGLSNVSVSVGDHVNQNAVIAQVSPARPRYAAGLYFEIRHFSEPENPHQWINSEIGHATVALQGVSP